MSKRYKKTLTVKARMANLRSHSNIGQDSNSDFSDNSVVEVVSSKSLNESFIERIESCEINSPARNGLTAKERRRANNQQYYEKKKTSRVEVEPGPVAADIRNIPSCVDIDISVSVHVWKKSTEEAVKLRKIIGQTKDGNIGKFDRIVKEFSQMNKGARHKSGSVTIEEIDEKMVAIKKEVLYLLYNYVWRGYQSQDLIMGNVFRQMTMAENITYLSIHDVVQKSETHFTKLMTTINAFKKVLGMKKKLFMSPFQFKLKKLTDESVENFAVRKLGLRRYHYRKDGESEEFFKPMEEILPDIHKKFEGRQNSGEELDMQELYDREVDIGDEKIAIDENEEAAAKVIVDAIISKTTKIRYCDEDCCPVDSKMFHLVERFILEMESYPNAITFAQALIRLESDTIPETNTTFPAFLKMFYDCFSGIRSITKKYQICENLSRGLLSLLNAAEIGTIENQNRLLALSNLHFSTQVLVKRHLPMSVERVDEQKIYEQFGEFIEKFRKEMRIQETEKCAVCHKLTLQNEIVKWSVAKISSYLAEEDKVAKEVGVCRSCRKQIGKKELPNDAVINGMEVEQIPESLKDLNWIEKAMIQIIRPIQSVVHLKDNGGRKTNIRGAGGVMVLVPVPVEGTINHLVNTLPSAKHLRIVVDAGFNMKIVSIRKMICALNWLKTHNELYKDVVINEAFQFTADDHIVFKKPSTIDQMQNLIAATGNDEKSLVTSADFEVQNLRDNECVSNPLGALQRYTMNKVEYNPQPIGGLKNLECLVFPPLFPSGRFGTSYKRKKTITLSKWLRQRLLNFDRQIAQDSDFLCFEFGRKTQLDITSSMGTNAQIKRNTEGRDLLKGLENGGVDFEKKMYTLFKDVRGFPPYWVHIGKELSAHVITFGPPQYFVTLNPNEDDWEDLHKTYSTITKRCVDKTNIRIEIGRDPVIWTRYFNRRIQMFMKNVLFANGGPLGGVIHWYWRIEYQHRGSEHVHLVLWTEKKFEEFSSPKEVAEFLDTVLTARLPSPHETELFKAVQYQMHWKKHSKTCLRYYTVGKELKSYCRFEFPRPVTPTTLVYMDDDSKRRKLPGVRSKESYSLARKPEECMINDYNGALLIGWGGNIDVQAIISEASPVLSYICGYTTKSETSKDTKITLFENSEHIQEQLSEWKVALNLMQQRQAGTPEICDILLGHHLYGFDTDHVFINTNESQKRHRKLVKFEKIKEDERVTECNVIDDYYGRRSVELESVSLFNFLIQFEVVRSSGARKTGDFEEKTNTQTTSPFQSRYHVNDKFSPFCCHPNVPVGATYEIVGMKEKVIRKKKGKVPRVYWPTISEGDSRAMDDFFRRLVFMFVPWRDEEEMLAEDESYEAKWSHYYQTIKVMHPSAYQDIEKYISGLKINAKRYAEGAAEKKRNAKLLEELEINLEVDEDEVMKMSSRRVDEASHEKNVEQLNTEQREIFETWMRHLENQEKGIQSNALKMFISGTAGTGKTHLIQCLADAITLFFNSTDLPSVMLSAPTGIAALGISGLTLHKLLLIEVQKGKHRSFAKLSPQKLEFLRCLFKKVALLVVDEISMCSNVMIEKISRRLIEIKGVNAPFGGINICVFGDLMQLAPVNAAPVFVPMTSKTVQELFSGISCGWTVWRDFQYRELTQNMRQREDLEFAEIMSRMRTDSMTPEDHAILASRVIPNNKNEQAVAEYYIELLEKDNCAMALLPTNEEVAKFNNLVVEAMKLETVTIAAVETDMKSFKVGSLKTHDNVKEEWSILRHNNIGFQPHSARNDVIRRPHQRKEFQYAVETNQAGIKINAGSTKNQKMKKAPGAETREHGGLPKSLTIAKGARVMLLRNIDVTSGLVNGARGYLRSIKYDAKDEPNGLCILFDGDEKERLICKVTVTYDGPGRTSISRTQFPISVSFAASVHKCQGLTLKNVMISMTQMFASGQSFVAFSRCKNLKGVHLLNYDSSKIKCSIDGLIEYNRLRATIHMDQFELPLPKTRKRKSTQERISDFHSSSPNVDMLVVTGSASHPTQNSSNHREPQSENVEEVTRGLGLQNVFDDCWLISIINVVNELIELRKAIEEEECEDAILFEMVQLFHQQKSEVHDLRYLMPLSFHDGHQDVADALHYLFQRDRKKKWQEIITMKRKRSGGCLCEGNRVEVDSYSVYEYGGDLSGCSRLQEMMDVIFGKEEEEVCGKCGESGMSSYEYDVPEEMKYLFVMTPCSNAKIEDLFGSGEVEVAEHFWRVKATMEYDNPYAKNVKYDRICELDDDVWTGHWHSYVRCENVWRKFDDDKVEEVDEMMMGWKGTLR